MFFVYGVFVAFWLQFLSDVHFVFSAEEVICPYPTGSPKCSGSPFIGFASKTHGMSTFGNQVAISCEFSCCGNVSLSLLVNEKPFNRTTISFTTTYKTGYIGGQKVLLSLTHLFFKADSDSDQGYYTCVLSQGSKNLQDSYQGFYFKGFSFGRLKYAISSISYTSDFQNTSSSSYKKAEALISTEISRKLDAFAIAKRRTIPIYEIRNHLVGIEVSLLVLQYVGKKGVHKKFCEILYRQLGGPFHSFNITSVIPSMVDCCNKQATGQKENRGIILWDFTPTSYGFSVFSEKVSTKCPYHLKNDVKYAHRKCDVSFSSGASWSAVNEGACLKLAEITSTSNLYRAKITNDTILAISQRFMNLTKENSNTTNSTQLSIEVTVMENILQSNKANNEVLNILLESASFLLNVKASTIVSAQEKYNTSTRLLSALDELGKQYGVQSIDQGVTVPNVNLIFMAANVNTTVKLGAKFSLNTSSNDSKFEENEALFSRATNLGIQQERSHETAFIPISMLDQAPGSSNESTIKIYGYVFANDKLFRTAEYKDANSSKISKVMSLTIMNTSVNNASDNIKLQWPNSSPNYDRHLCSFWDFNKGWSQNGCSVSYSSSQQTICQCNHLTNFALIFKYDDSETSDFHKSFLSMITFVGCGLSITCLLLTIITVVLFGKIQKLLPPKILIGQSVSLSATYFIFIFGVERSTNRTSCGAVAAVLHYFVLSTFMWNVVEGINLYSCFVTVYNNHVANFMIKACFFAYGLPLLVVTATAVTRFHQDYGPGQYCIVAGHSFYIALLAPTATILLMNIYILARVMRSISRSHSLNSKSSNMRKGKIWFSCACLLGLTWIFGVFTVVTTSLIFQYLFCITASFQGFFLFLFHCLLNRNVKGEVIKVFNERIPDSFRQRMSNAVGCQTDEQFRMRNAVFKIRNVYVVSGSHVKRSPNFSAVQI